MLKCRKELSLSLREKQIILSLSDQNNEYFLFARLEKESFKTLDKPQNFAHAQEIEKEAVLFAKEVNFHLISLFSNSQ